MANILKKHLKEIEKLQFERKAWLVLSAFVIVSVIYLIFNFHDLSMYHHLVPVGILGIILCVVWWFWSMRIIKKLMTHRTEEIEVLISIHESIKEIREDVRKSFPK